MSEDQYRIQQIEVKNLEDFGRTHTIALDSHSQKNRAIHRIKRREDKAGIWYDIYDYIDGTSEVSQSINARIVMRIDFEKK